jgi:hypothetical protein
MSGRLFSREGGKLLLRPDVRVHLYTSAQPCGNASRGGLLARSRSSVRICRNMHCLLMTTYGYEADRMHIQLRIGKGDRFHF